LQRSGVELAREAIGRGSIVAAAVKPVTADVPTPVAIV
jgi:hypothetical protein